MDVAAGASATLKAAWMDPAGLGIAMEGQATINGGTSVPLAPAVLATQAVSDSGLTQLWVGGVDLADVVRLSLIRTGLPPVDVTIERATNNYLTAAVAGGAVPEGSTVELSTNEAPRVSAPISEFQPANVVPYAVDHIILHLAPAEVTRSDPANPAPIGSYTFAREALSSALSGAGVVTLAPLLPWFSHSDTLSTNFLGESVTLVDMTDFYIATLAPGTDARSATALVKNTPGVRSANVDPVVVGFTAPNAPLFYQQWWLQNSGNPVCGTPASAGIDVGVGLMWAWPSGRPEVHVGILDSGIDVGHRELTPYVDADTAFIDPPATQDLAGHGTPIAGIVGAVRDEGFGVAGLASGVRLIATKVLNNMNAGFESQAIAGIDRARAMRLPIVNMSWGTLPPYYMVTDTVEALYDVAYNAKLAGCLLVAAAGNAPIYTNLAEHNYEAYPATMANRVLTVGAVLPDGSRWSDARINQGYCGGSTQSNIRCWASNHFGSSMDVCAPGGRFIVTTLRAPDVEDVLDGCDNTTLSGTAFGGTSAAAPIVSGVAALLMSISPSITSDDVEITMKATAYQPVFPQGTWNELYGWGLVRADRAMDFLWHSRVLQNGVDVYATSGNGLHVSSQGSVGMTFDNVFGWGSSVLGPCTQYTLEDTISFPGSFNGTPNAWLRVSGTRGLDPRVRYYNYVEQDSLRGGQIVSLSSSGMRFRTAVYNVPGHGWFPNAPEEAQVGWTAVGRPPVAAVKGMQGTVGLDVRTVPNPAKVNINFDVELPVRARLELSVFDVAGRRVDTLADATYGPGPVSFQWRRGVGGRRAGPGLYFCRAAFGNQIVTKRFVLLRGSE